MAVKYTMFVALILTFLAGCDAARLQTFSGSTMGTTYTVKVVGQNLPDNLGDLLDSELIRINSLMSTYDVQSELSRFNHSRVNEPFTVSPDLISVVKLARTVFEDSDHAFDPTIGPLVNLWGFGPDPALDVVPSDSAIMDALARVGFTALVIGSDSLTRDKALYVDLSAIAKGYAVDQLALILDGHGLKDYLVEVGGELRASGHNEAGRIWTIAIETPDKLSRSIFRALPLRDMGMATSGDYRNYFEVDGVRYSHTIDPKTGRPITNNIASVTVLASSTALADGYATAIGVLGLERGMLMADEQNLPVLVIIKTSSGFVERLSTRLEQYLDEMQ